MSTRGSCRPYFTPWSNRSPLLGPGSLRIPHFPGLSTGVLQVGDGYLKLINIVKSTKVDPRPPVRRSAPPTLGLEVYHAYPNTNPNIHASSARRQPPPGKLARCKTNPSKRNWSPLNDFPRPSMFRRTRRRPSSALRQPDSYEIRQSPHQLVPAGNSGVAKRTRAKRN